MSDPSLWLDFGKIGLAAGMAASLTHYLTKRRDAQKATREFRAAYLRQAFNSLTEFSLYLQFSEVRKELDIEALKASANKAINEMELLGDTSLQILLSKFRMRSQSPDHLQESIFRLEKLRTAIRDQFRKEVGLEAIKDPIKLDFWNFK